MSSIVDRIFGWFSGSRKEEEPVAEEENVAAQEEEQAVPRTPNICVWGDKI